MPLRLTEKAEIELLTTKEAEHELKIKISKMQAKIIEKCLLKVETN